MGLKKRMLALLCAGALLLGLSPAPARAVEDEVCFLALNNQLSPQLAAGTMPISVDGAIYVPYSVFDSGVSGVDLIVKIVSDAKQIMLYTKQKSLRFDLSSGTCTDKVGSGDYPGAVMRGGVTYLPAASIGAHFKEDGLTYSYRTTEYGPLVRFTTPSVSLNDDQFIAAALPTMANMLRAYRNQNPSTTTPAVPITPPAVTPTRPGELNPPDKRGVAVYLAFRCMGGDELVSILGTLDREKVTAVFFFRPEDLPQNEALVRRIVASGHVVGLAVPGGPAEDAKALLTEGNRLLALIAHMNTRTVLVENGDASVTAALAGEGWSLWESNVPVPDAAYAPSYSAALLKSADQKRSFARIALPDSALVSAALPAFLRDLRAERYALRLAVETEL